MSFMFIIAHGFIWLFAIAHAALLPVNAWLVLTKPDIYELNPDGFTEGQVEALNAEVARLEETLNEMRCNDG